MNLIAETQAPRTMTPSSAPPRTTHPFGDDTGDHASAVLSVSRPDSTAGIHQPHPAVSLTILPIARARWFQGLVNPRVPHLLETEDGRPRTLNIDGHTVRVAVCRSWLTDAAVDVDTTVDASAAGCVAVCVVCLAMARDLERRAGAR